MPEDGKGRESVRVAAYQAPLLDVGSMEALDPVFQVDALTFGVVVCNDSNFSEPARLIAAQGATALFVPTNNGMPHARDGAELPALARNVDITRAVENSLWVIRADVAGRTRALTSHGSSGIVDPDGMVVASAPMSEALLVAQIDCTVKAQELNESAQNQEA